MKSEGPVPADVLVVGEAPLLPGADAILSRMLNEAQLFRPTVHYYTMLGQAPAYGKPVDMAEAVATWQRLCELHETVKPKVVVALGAYPLLCLTGKTSIMEWRGSQLEWNGTPVIGTFEPGAVARQWTIRPVVVSDFRRAARIVREGPQEPQFDFIIRPSFEKAIETLEYIVTETHGPLSFDIETIEGHIRCAAIAWNERQAICLPFWHDYWSAEQETELVWRLRKILTTRPVVGQNLLYDAQYTQRWWMFTPKIDQDTMVSYHACFAESARDDTNEKTGKKGKAQGIKKSLDFLASLYCRHYVQWKHLGHDTEDSLWFYNCEDVARTYEVAMGVRATAEALNLEGPHTAQQRMVFPVLAAMNKGVRIDLEMRDRLSKELKDEIKEREKWIKEVLGHTLNPKSPKQMRTLFYGDFAQKPILKRRADGTFSPTLDDDALMRLSLREPLLRPLVNTLLDSRTLGVLRSTFIQAPLDTDGRMRCSYSLCGTITYRLSSSSNAFGTGANLQNIPNAKSKVNVKVAKRGSGLKIPNVRAMFIPDPGYTFFDMDLERADLQVVAWEADDAELKAMLREGADIHSENARVLGINRELAKTWVHGTNYGGMPTTMAKQCGISVDVAGRLRTTWFQAHPGIAAWHERTKGHLEGRRWVENAWGYRWYIFDRTDNLLPAALAWIPQSTVAVLINRIWERLYREAPNVEVLLQVHDSLAGQFKGEFPMHLTRIPIPYADPLIIPAGLKTSTTSWGACE